jgi:RNA polymerase sigma factor (TIGR02999 family)
MPVIWEQSGLHISEMTSRQSGFARPMGPFHAPVSSRSNRCITDFRNRIVRCDREMALGPSDTTEIARLMKRFRQGDREAAGRLVEIFYPELRRLAAANMIRERPGHTWQPTALVNELYMELVKINALRASGADGSAERAAFFGLAAHLMRRLLIHHARPLAKQAQKIELPELPDRQSPGLGALAEVEDALNRLSTINPRLRTIVESKVFEGLTTPQIAERMNCGTATVERHWSFARQWLAEEFGKATT